MQGLLFLRSIQVHSYGIWLSRKSLVFAMHACFINTLIRVEWNKRLVKSMLIYIYVFHNNTRKTIEDENVKSQLFYVVTRAIKESVK